MAPPLPAAAAAMVEAYAKKVEKAARREAGPGWDSALEKLKTEGGPAARAAALREAAALVLAPRWAELSGAEFSASYLCELHLERRRAAEAAEAEAAAEDTAAVAAALAAVPSPAPPGAARAALAAFLAEAPGPPALVFLERLVAERALPPADAAGLRDEFLTAACRAAGLPLLPWSTAPEAHPALKMGLTFGCRPRPPAGGQDRSGTKLPLLNFGLPGGEAVVYDLAALLAGADYPPESGLNFQLDARLDTVRPAGRGGRPTETSLSELSPPAGARAAAVGVFFRQDAAAAVPRLVLAPAASPPAAVLLQGPRAALEAYNALAYAAVADPASGFTVANLAGVTQAAEAETVPYAAAQAAARAAAQGKRREAAAARAAGRAVAAREAPPPVSPLPGFMAARGGEEALTAVAEAWQEAAGALPAAGSLKRAAGKAGRAFETSLHRRT